MIFAGRQIQEKCREQKRDLLILFIDLTKAFDTVNRQALWRILSKCGCPEKFINIVKQLHDDMVGSVSVHGETTENFGITTGVKQGCVLAPTLFGLFFAVMIRDVVNEIDEKHQDISSISSVFATMAVSSTSATSKPRPKRGLSSSTSSYMRTTVRFYPEIEINGCKLHVVNQFTYLGSIMSDDCKIDKEIEARIKKASASYGRLTDRV